MEQYIDGRWQTDPRGDLGRIDRQQTFMKRLATEGFRRSVNSPSTALDIADETIPKLKADEALNSDDIKKLITSFRRVDPNDPNSLEMVTFPTVTGPRNSRLGDTLEAKEPDADAILARLRQFGPAPTQQNGPNATQVHYRPGSLDKARVVQSYLGGVGKLVEDKAIVEADVGVVLGTDFKAVTPPPNAPAPDSAAPAPTTAAPAPSTAAAGKGKAPAPPPDPTQCA